MRLSLRILGCLVGTAVLFVACGRKASPPPAVVIIDTPANGDTVRGAAVQITLTARGVELAPAADERPGTAHHHLFLDVETGPLDRPIPAGVTGIIHLGRAQTEFHWDSVAPGPHRIIAVLGDSKHVPLVPLASDTVHFVVQPR